MTTDPLSLANNVPAQLEWLEGPLRGQWTELTVDYFIIGREPAFCRVVIEADAVSRRHAALEVNPAGEVTIVDLASTNGTHVNGERVSRRTLSDGDRLSFGPDGEASCIFRAAHTVAPGESPRGPTVVPSSAPLPARGCLPHDAPTVNLSVMQPPPPPPLPREEVNVLGLEDEADVLELDDVPDVSGPSVIRPPALEVEDGSGRKPDFKFEVVPGTEPAEPLSYGEGREVKFGAPDAPASAAEGELNLEVVEKRASGELGEFSRAEGWSVADPDRAFKEFVAIPNTLPSATARAEEPSTHLPQPPREESQPAAQAQSAAPPPDAHHIPANNRPPTVAQKDLQPDRLPARMRELVRSINSLTDSYSGTIAKLAKQREEALKAAAKKLEAAKKRLESEASANDSALKVAEAEALRLKNEIESKRTHARSHLSSQGVMPDHTLGWGQAGLRDGAKGLEEAKSSLQEVSRQLSDLTQTKKPQNAGSLIAGFAIPGFIISCCAAAGASRGSGPATFLVVNLLFTGLGVIIAIVRNTSAMSEMEAKYRLLLTEAETAVGRLEAFREHARTEHGRAHSEIERLLQQAHREHAHEVEAAEHAHGSERKGLERRTQATAAKLRAACEAFYVETSFAGLDWRDEGWRNWAVVDSLLLSARVGAIVSPQFDLRLPAMLSFRDERGGRCLLLEATGKPKEDANLAVQATLLRLLANVPPGKVLFTLIDPVGLGQNVAPFMPLADFEEKLITSRAWTEPRHIEEQLSKLTEHMENVIQKYLRNDYATIEDYNRSAGEVAEPYRVLVVLDFPVNFSDSAARRLVSIARNGPRCGVYTIIVRDTAKPAPHGFNVADLEQSAHVIEWSGAAANQPEAPVPAVPVAGETYTGTVSRIADFGAFVEILPGVDGMLHISEIAKHHVRDVREELTEGQQIRVKCIAVQGNKIKLSRKAALADEGEYGTKRDVSAPVVAAKPARSFVWKDKDVQRYALTLDLPPKAELSRSIITTVGERSKDTMRVEVPFDRLLEMAGVANGGRWKGSTIDMLRVPLGPSGARKIQYLTFGKGTEHHAVVIGMPGSGKSNLMHIIVTSMALIYPPNEAQLYLIDFKQGVEFKRYAEAALPHAHVVAIESEREFGLSVLKGLDEKLHKRGEKFRKRGVNSLSEYRRAFPDEEMPRVLLLVDEFQEFFSYDDQIAREAGLLLDRLVRQGRYAGIHVMLGSQSLANRSSLPSSTLGQIGIRIALKCSESDARQIMADDNPQARLLSRPGEAIYNAASGLIEGNNFFQVALFTEEDRQARLDEVKRLAAVAVSGGARLEPPIVFEGNEPSRLETCAPLKALLESDAYASASKGRHAWLGEPVAISQPTHAWLRRQGASHLLVVTRNEEEGVGMLMSAFLSLAAQAHPDEARFYLADLSTADTAWEGLAREIADMLPHRIQVTGRHGMTEALKGAAELVERRLKGEASGEDLYFFIQGLHRARDLREEEGGRGRSIFDRGEGGREPSPHELFARVLREGPECGVHVVTWCDAYANVKRTLGRGLGEFALRVAGAMSSDDSMGLLDDSAASKLDRPHRAIFFDDERPGRLEKFRPYAIPERGWLADVARALARRASASRGSSTGG